jgi:hypothetical protein
MGVSDNEILAGFVTREQFAGAINRSVRTVDRYHVLRIGPPRIQVARTVPYSVESIKDWLRSREQRSGQTR